MPRLPIPGKDQGTWGQILNSYLSQSHQPDGTLKPDTITPATIPNNSIPLSKLSPALQTKINDAIGQDGTDGQDGADGRNIELRSGPTHLEWRYQGDPTWTNLVPLADITGPAGEDGAQGPQGDQGDPATNLVESVNGQQGEVALDAEDIGAIPLAGNVTLSAASGTAVSFDIDGEDASGPDRMLFRVWKDGSWRPVSWFNEYGEVRVIPSANSRVGFRVFGANTQTEWNARNPNTPIMNIENYRTGTGSRTTVWKINHRGDTEIGGELAVGGTVSAPNIGNKVTTSDTAPSSPAIGDVWIDTST